MSLSRPLAGARSAGSECGSVKTGSLISPPKLPTGLDRLRERTHTRPQAAARFHTSHTEW